jgi:sortase A
MSSPPSHQVSYLLERTLLALGCALLFVYAGWQLQSYVISQAALLSFRAHQLPAVVHAASTRSSDSTVDFALWSVQRMVAYKESLAMKLNPPLAVLSIPRLKLEVPVFNGTDDLTLNRGAGRVAGTALPGHVGNIAIAAHRDGFFRGLKDIRLGDRVALQTDPGDYVYRVDNISIVEPSDTSVLRPGDKSSITLITCYPFYFVGNAPQRYIVHASLVGPTSSTASSLKSAVQPRYSEDMP